MVPKKLENNFLVSTLGKLLVFLVNYAYLPPFFIMKKLGKLCFGSFGTHYRYFYYFLWEKQSYLRPTWVTTSPLERSKFVSQGHTVSNYRDQAWKMNICLMWLSLKLSIRQPKTEHLTPVTVSTRISNQRDWICNWIYHTCASIGSFTSLTGWYRYSLLPIPPLAQLRARIIRTIHTSSWGWLSPGVRGNPLKQHLELAKGESRYWKHLYVFVQQANVSALLSAC
jgi:hypothetical protein